MQFRPKVTVQKPGDTLLLFTELNGKQNQPNQKMLPNIKQKKTGFHISEDESMWKKKNYEIWLLPMLSHPFAFSSHKKKHTENKEPTLSSASVYFTSLLPLAEEFENNGCSQDHCDQQENLANWLFLFSYFDTR